MDPGKLNKRITVLKNSDQHDSHGEPLDPIEYFTCWASVKNKSGNEMFKAGTNFSKAITSFLVRYRKDKQIDTTMKIRFNSHIYDITYVDNYNFSNQWIELTAEKVI